MNKFTLDIQAFVAKAKKNPETVMRSVSLKLFSAIIKASPVDEGLFRGNWQASGATPATGVLKTPDKSGDITINRMSNFVQTTPSWQEMTLANNSAQSLVIEYGGYPSPVKRGTWNKKTKKYEIRSIGGYSKQAPQGVVRVNITRFNTLLNEEAAKVR